MQDELTALQLELLNSEERNSSTKSPSSLQSPSTNEGQTQSSLYAAQHLVQNQRLFIFYPIFTRIYKQVDHLICSL